MKVLMQGKLELFSSGGGDKVQIDHTAEELRKLGIEVDIACNWKVDYSKYDLVHIFQLDWMPESYFYARNAQKFGKPIVLSPIHHNFSEVKKFDDQYAFDFRRISRVLFKDQFNRDTFKNIYKSFFFPRKLYPTLYSALFGFKRMLSDTIKMSDYVLVQTDIEAEDLKNIYGQEFNWAKIPNGVGKEFTVTPADVQNKLPFDNYVVCVGRVEARKNQINVIKAMQSVREKLADSVSSVPAKNNSPEQSLPQLVFLGKKSWLRHPEFVLRFERLLKKFDWIHHIESVEYSEMPSIYKFAKVCVSASWFESTGLTSLEALFCDTNAVASGPQAQEYLGSHASYCDPGSIESITEAILKEYAAERPKIPENMKKEYTWENAAIRTLEVYKSLLK